MDQCPRQDEEYGETLGRLQKLRVDASTAKPSGNSLQVIQGSIPTPLRYVKHKIPGLHDTYLHIGN